jgi:hypothetical protein
MEGARAVVGRPRCVCSGLLTLAKADAPRLAGLQSIVVTMRQDRAGTLKADDSAVHIRMVMAETIYNPYILSAYELIKTCAHFPSHPDSRPGTLATARGISCPTSES